MMRFLKDWIVRRRFRRMMAGYEARIAEARKKHRPVRHIVQEQRRFLHQALACSPGEQRANVALGSRPRFRWGVAAR